MKNAVKIILLSSILLSCQSLNAQINVHTEDLPRFYQAFDNVFTIKDSLQQINIFKTLYEDKASIGLKKFMELRGGNSLKWREWVLQDSARIAEKRPWILSVLKQEKTIYKKIKVFKKIYPSFRDGDIYFCIGINNSGGTVFDNTVYIGTEVVASKVDDWAVFTVLHEFVHTQQWSQRNIYRITGNDSLLNDYFKTHTQLLGKCLEEGVADFVAELAYGKSLVITNPKGHTAYGFKNEKKVWEEFKTDMFKTFDDKMGWLYGQRKIGEDTVSDLGYFMGYLIAKTYYMKSKDKQSAVKEMIETDFTDKNARLFLLSSGYLTEKEANKIMKN